MKVMFVCTGNTCRSPMAEAIFKDMAKGIEVHSVGFSTFSGEPASNKAIIVCGNHDLDLLNHRTTNIGDSKIEDMDLILTATVEHRDKIRRLFPDLEAFTIKEYAGGYDDLNISDPVCGSLKDYENCFWEIKEALEKIHESLDYH